jgi:hypothetical protein
MKEQRLAGRKNLAVVLGCQRPNSTIAAQLLHVARARSLGRAISYSKSGSPWWKRFELF